MKPQTLEIGFSPCPNDTFMFYAMVSGKVDTEGLNFEASMGDIEVLNRKALNNELPISKISFYNYLFVMDEYNLLQSGAALGHSCGPLVISKRLTKLENGVDYEVAIPGVNTTANFLFTMFYPWVKNKKAILFSDIERSLLSEEFHVGVIIHENRFTYEKKGLLKIADLGELWENETHSPIPLGGIVIRKGIDEETQKKVERIIKRSIEYAYANTAEVMEYVKQYSQEMEESVMKQHIDLYVNEYSLDLGEKGRRAVETFKVVAEKLGTGKTQVASS